MLLCPNCSEKLVKNPKHGEGVWYCPHKDCGEVWYILNLPTPDYLKPKNKKTKVKHKVSCPSGKGPGCYPEDNVTVA